MNKTIAKMYELTKDAVLVDKHFGKEIPENTTAEFVYKPHAKEILEAAVLKEAQEKAKEAKS